MKPIQIRPLLALGILLTARHDLNAALLVTDPIAGYETGQLGDAATGGGGIVGSWIISVPQVTVTSGIGSLDGTGLGLQASTGDRVSIAGAYSDEGVYKRFAAFNTFPPDVAANIYYSFLYQFNVGSDVSAGGQAINGVNRANSGRSNPLGFDWYLQARNFGDAIRLGLSRNGGTTTNYASNPISPGQTFLVVIREQITASSAVPNIIDLWINPPAGTFGAGEGSVPLVSATTFDGIDDTSFTGPGRFWLFPSGASAEFDELRIGTTWADVTPVPEPTAFGLLLLSAGTLLMRRRRYRRES